MSSSLIPRPRSRGASRQGLVLVSKQLYHNIAVAILAQVGGAARSPRAPARLPRTLAFLPRPAARPPAMRASDDESKDESEDDASILSFGSMSDVSVPAAHEAESSPEFCRFSSSNSNPFGAAAADSDMAISGSDAGSPRSEGGFSATISSQSEPEPVGENTWVLGRNCGFSHLDFGEQAQVLVANATYNLGFLPPQLSIDLLAALGYAGARFDRERQLALAQLILGLRSRYEVRSNWATLASNQWAPRPAPDRRTSGVSADVRRQALLVRVREAVDNSAWGLPLSAYIAAVQRLEMAGVRLGSKYNHHAFTEEVEHMAYVSCLAVSAFELNQLTPSTGAPPDIAVTWDGVGIGGTMFSRAETCCIIGVSFMTSSGLIVQRLVEAPSENLRKAGEPQKELVLRALARHPARLAIPVLRTRLRLVAGDGAICQGGVDALHSSTKSAEALWAEVFGSEPDAPPPCTEWDLFHRVDAAVGHALKAHRACVEYTEVARACGVSRGVLSWWLCGRDTHLPCVFKAGAAAMRWHEENQGRPTPGPSAEPLPYNAADAARVRALMARLGVKQKELARACGVKKSGLSHWLRGIDTHMPSVIKAGAAAMRWHEGNQVAAASRFPSCANGTSTEM